MRANLRHKSHPYRLSGLLLTKLLGMGYFQTVIVGSPDPTLSINQQLVSPKNVAAFLGVISHHSVHLLDKHSFAKPQRAYLSSGGLYLRALPQTSCINLLQNTPSPIPLVEKKAVDRKIHETQKSRLTE